MTVDEIRAAREEAAQQIRHVLTALAAKTGLNLLGARIEIIECHSGMKTTYQVGEVQVELTF